MRAPCRLMITEALLNVPGVYAGARVRQFLQQVVDAAFCTNMQVTSHQPKLNHRNISSMCMQDSIGISPPSSGVTSSWRKSQSRTSPCWAGAVSPACCQRAVRWRPRWCAWRRWWCSQRRSRDFARNHIVREADRKHPRGPKQQWFRGLGPATLSRDKHACEKVQKTNNCE